MSAASNSRRATRVTGEQGECAINRVRILVCASDYSHPPLRNRRTDPLSLGLRVSVITVVQFDPGETVVSCNLGICIPSNSNLG